MKIVDINTGKNLDLIDEEIPKELLEGLTHFIGAAVESKVRGFAAVAVTKEGNVIDSWHCHNIPAPTLLGAIELLKTQFQKEVIRDR